MGEKKASSENKLHLIVTFSIEHTHKDSYFENSQCVFILIPKSFKFV